MIAQPNKQSGAEVDSGLFYLCPTGDTVGVKNSKPTVGENTNFTVVLKLNT